MHLRRRNKDDGNGGKTAARGGLELAAKPSMVAYASKSVVEVLSRLVPEPVSGAAFTDRVNQLLTFVMVNYSTQLSASCGLRSFVRTDVRAIHELPPPLFKTDHACIKAVSYIYICIALAHTHTDRDRGTGLCSCSMAPLPASLLVAVCCGFINPVATVTFTIFCLYGL